MSDRTYVWNQASLKHAQTPRRHKPVGPVGPTVEVLPDAYAVRVNGVTLSVKDAFSLGIDIPEAGISAHGPFGDKRGDGRIPCEDCGYHVCGCVQREEMRLLKRNTQWRLDMIEVDGAEPTPWVADITPEQFHQFVGGRDYFDVRELKKLLPLGHVEGFPINPQIENGRASCERKYNFPISVGFATGQEQGSFELTPDRPCDDYDTHRRLHDEAIAEHNRERPATEGCVKNGREYTLPTPSRPALLTDIMPAGKLWDATSIQAEIDKLIGDVVDNVRKFEFVPNDPKDAAVAKDATAIVNHMLPRTLAGRMQLISDLRAQASAMRERCDFDGARILEHKMNTLAHDD